MRGVRGDGEGEGVSVILSGDGKSGGDGVRSLRVREIPSVRGVWCAR